MIPNSEINGLGTLQAVFSSLLHARLTGYSTVTNNIYGKIMNYQSGSAFFTMANQFKIDRSFSSNLLPSADFFLLFLMIK